MDEETTTGAPRATGRSKWPLIVGLILIIVVAGAVLFWSRSSSQSGAPATETDQIAQTVESASSTNNSSVMNGMVATVTYTDQGFSPQTVTIMQGGTVTFVNQSSGQMWIASNPHPVHSGYDGTTLQQHCAQGYTGPAPFDECVAVPAGGSFPFTFDAVGSWGYHNHIVHGDTGTVVVTAQ